MPNGRAELTLEQLRALEFADFGDDDDPDTCPVCGAKKGEAHYPDCWLAPAIAEAERVDRAPDSALAQLAAPLSCYPTVEAISAAIAEILRENAQYEIEEQKREAERVETAAERVARAEKDGFVWEADNPEESCDPVELLSNYGGDIAEVMLGTNLPSAFGFSDDDGDHWFDTLAEAEAALEAATAAHETTDAQRPDTGPVPQADGCGE